MRYLRATAQDLCGNGQADTVILHFYRQHADGPDELVHEAIAVDMNADGQVDSPPDAPHAALLASFACAFFKLGWFNAAGRWQRTLTLYVNHFSKTGRPNAVKLDFHERAGCTTSRVYRAAAYDGDGDGVLESFTNSDVDHNGVADHADKALIRSLCSTFLAFEWYDRSGVIEPGGQCVDLLLTLGLVQPGVGVER